MSVLKEFKLPDVGEGLTEADIVRWHVKPGDTVAINQIIVEIETAKAIVELPSPYEGTVASLLVPEGQTADVGTPIIAVNVGADAGGGAEPTVAVDVPAETAAQHAISDGRGPGPGSAGGRRGRARHARQPGAEGRAPGGPGRLRRQARHHQPAAPARQPRPAERERQH